ncbi:MAG: RluA family pseudouridine synthase [Candidatus Pacebacteria bacterium]|nr:RluA family pseudouridine synthase [Candidatus Paceibacterota bacterium]
MENIEIVFENKDFLVVNKPAGLLVHRVAHEQAHELIHEKIYEQKTLVDWLVKRYPKIIDVGEDKNRPGIVHRLDRETSGLLIVAKNQKTFDYFKKIFQEHRIKKGYLALVYGEFKNKKGVINKPIGIVASSIKRSTAAKKMKELKEAITEYEVLTSFEYQGEKFSLVKVSPKTGRTHQIRVHLSSIGHPVVGDKIYGRKKEKIVSRLFLHAYLLEFPLPDDGILRLESELPADLKKVLENLKCPSRIIDKINKGDII